MKIKIGDNVRICNGKDAGKSGKVLQILTNKNGEAYVVVEGLNKRTKHLKSQGQNQSGQAISYDAPLHMSNVMLLDSKGTPSRVGFKLDGSTKKRVLKRTGEFVN